VLRISGDLAAPYAEATDSGLSVVSRSDERLPVPELADAVITQIILAGGTKAIGVMLAMYRKAHSEAGDRSRPGQPGLTSFGAAPVRYAAETGDTEQKRPSGIGGTERWRIDVYHPQDAQSPTTRRRDALWRDSEHG
jgi:hypothetical protein